MSWKHQLVHNKLVKVTTGLWPCAGLLTLRSSSPLPKRYAKILTMNWIEDSKKIFFAKKPEHFTNFGHCEECAEHDETLINSSIDTIGLEELGNPGWDPICFSSEEGKKYYMPSLIRLSLDTIDSEFYFGNFLLHLESDGHDNKLYLSCSAKQRLFICRFIEYMILEYTSQIEANGYENEVLKVQAIWSDA